MVAIKDMEMPNSCYECDLHNYHNCDLTNDDIEKHLDDSKHPNCPLVEIEERKVGEWIYDKAIENWRCSVCNKTPKTMGFCGTADFMEKEFAFCNHCGTKMRGAENG